MKSELMNRHKVNTTHHEWRRWRQHPFLPATHEEVRGCLKEQRPDDP